MSSTARIPFHIDITRVIDVLAKQIYQSPLALLRENCQNAYDAILMRKQLNDDFLPQITVGLSPRTVSVSDNGIGMTPDDLVSHYWRAGASGKNTPEARAAGVVGTFGIGAMANFGIATELVVETESARTGQRTRCSARRETLSATEDCIDISQMKSLGTPGTSVTAQIAPATAIDIANATAYLKECVRFVTVPVTVNNVLISQEDFEASVDRPREPVGWSHIESDVRLGPQVISDVELVLSKNGDVWVRLGNLKYAGEQIRGVAILRQGLHQIKAFRSRFTLATTAVSSYYQLGGIADFSILEPTAGREALTTPSLQLLQSVVTGLEEYISLRIAPIDIVDSNTGFMEWASKRGRYDLCGQILTRIEPSDRQISLAELRQRSNVEPLNCFDGTDEAIIKQYGTEEKPLVVLATRQPRRACQSTFLRAYCKTSWVTDAPSVVSRKAERDMTTAEYALALRIASILTSDYFVRATIHFGIVSHNLPVFVDVNSTPVEIVLDNRGSTVATMLKLHDTDFTALTGIAKDFVRNIIFPKVASIVPSSTREGAEAFLRAIRKPRDVFEYEKSDLGNLSEIWQEYLEGRISLESAAHQSASIVRATVQVVDRSNTSTVGTVLPDVVENEMLLAQAQRDEGDERFAPLPSIARLDIESAAKLLLIPDGEPALRGYRCFIAITERVREDRGEFFLQPHRTEVIWGGLKALYIFQHHSGRFGLYYELQGSEPFATTSGGRAFPTCTIVLKNQTFIPVPEDIASKFIPTEAGRKRFEIRCELLYVDSSTGDSDDSPSQSTPNLAGK